MPKLDYLFFETPCIDYTTVNFIMLQFSGQRELPTCIPYLQTVERGLGFLQSLKQQKIYYIGYSRRSQTYTKIYLCNLLLVD